MTLAVASKRSRLVPQGAVEVTNGSRTMQNTLMANGPHVRTVWGLMVIAMACPASRCPTVWLEDAKIETRMIFAGNIVRQPAFQGAPHRIAGDLRESDRVMTDALFIGVYPGLTDEMIDFVVARFHAFFKARHRSSHAAAAAQTA